MGACPTSFHIAQVRCGTKQGKAMANVWYYLKDKKTFGPVGPAELKRLTSTGGLLPSDLNTILLRNNLAQMKADREAAGK